MRLATLSIGYGDNICYDSKLCNYDVNPIIKTMKPTFSSPSKTNKLIILNK